MLQIGGIGILIIAFFFLLWLWNSINIIKEWERGVVLRLGRLLPEAKGAGLRLVFWPIETLYRISMRLETSRCAAARHHYSRQRFGEGQRGYLFRVVDANLALSQVQNYQYATSQLAQDHASQRCGPVRTGRDSLATRQGERQAADDSRSGHRAMGHQSQQSGSEAGGYSGADATRHRQAS